jgi:hypothetical protein
LRLRETDEGKSFGRHAWSIKHPAGGCWPLPAKNSATTRTKSDQSRTVRTADGGSVWQFGGQRHRAGGRESLATANGYSAGRVARVGGRRARQLRAKQGATAHR